MGTPVVSSFRRVEIIDPAKLIWEGDFGYRNNLSTHGTRLRYHRARNSVFQRVFLGAKIRRSGRERLRLRQSAGDAAAGLCRGPWQVERSPEQGLVRVQEQ